MARRGEPKAVIDKKLTRQFEMMVQHKRTVGEILGNSGMEVKDVKVSPDYKSMSFVAKSRDGKRTLFLEIFDVKLTKSNIKDYKRVIENCFVNVPYNVAIAGLKVNKLGNRRQLIIDIASKHNKKPKNEMKILVVLEKPGKDVKVSIETNGDEQTYKFAKTIVDYAITYGWKLF